MNRSVPLRRRTPIRRGKPLPRISAKRRAGAGAWAKVYVEVDRRSGGRCEIPLCASRAADHHHCVKPRRSWHKASLVIALCRPHHERVEAPYSTGRLLIAPLGDGRFRFRVVTAPDKFAARRRA